MPKINQEEYEVLKDLDDKWKWIARDGFTGIVNVYEDKPRKIGLVKEWAPMGDRANKTIFKNNLFQFIQWEGEGPYSIAELIEEYEYSTEHVSHVVNERVRALGKAWSESEETEVKTLESLREEIWVEMKRLEDDRKYRGSDVKYQTLREVLQKLGHLDEPEQPKITLQDVTDKLWELPLNNRKLWLARLNDEFQEGYIVPLGLKTTDGEEQYLTYNGSYFASRRNKHLQQTFDTLEDIPEFYRGLAERVL